MYVYIYKILYTERNWKVEYFITFHHQVSHCNDRKGSYDHHYVKTLILTQLKYSFFNKVFKVAEHSFQVAMPNSP